MQDRPLAPRPVRFGSSLLPGRTGRLLLGCLVLTLGSHTGQDGTPPGPGPKPRRGRGVVVETNPHPTVPTTSNHCRRMLMKVHWLKKTYKPLPTMDVCR